jgi:hypothetical protein
VPRADDFIRLTTILSTSKGEDYEDVESNAVDGGDRTRCGRDGKGGTYGVLPVGRLLRVVLRLQVKADKQEGRGPGGLRPLFSLAPVRRSRAPRPRREATSANPVSQADPVVI